MNIPTDIKYTKDHEWIRIEDNTGIVGITDFAQRELGDIVFIDISSSGETLAKGSVFGSVEAVKTVSDLFLPMSGSVIEVNKDLTNSPELVNKDPYGKGWIIKINITQPDEYHELLSAEQYKELIHE